MPEVVQDPTGLEVVLTDECWQHITDHHPEIRPFKQFVLETIQRPDAIYRGKRDPTRRIYKKNYLEVAGVGNALDILVFVGDADGYVATAYLCAYSFRMLGTLIWPSN